jgi:L-amino acid N-acyltransferase YncA
LAAVNEDYSVRHAVAGDARQIAEIYAHYVTTSPASFEVEPPPESEIRRRIEATIGSHPWVVAEAGEELLGYGYAGPLRERAAYRFSAEVSVYVRAMSQRRGVGRAVVARVLDELSRSGFANAFAGITLPNPGSVALFESFGFEPIGVYRNVGYKLGAWHDVGWWQRELRGQSPGSA